MSVEPSASWVLGSTLPIKLQLQPSSPSPGRQADRVSACVAAPQAGRQGEPLPQAPPQAGRQDERLYSALRLSHSGPRSSRHLLAPWMLSALPLAVLSPPSWDPMPSRYHCPSVRRSATASTPPTHGATTGGCWRRSLLWTGEYPRLQSRPLPSSSGPGTAMGCESRPTKADLQLSCPCAVIRDRSTAGLGCTEPGVVAVPLHVLRRSVPCRELACKPGGL